MHGHRLNLGINPYIYNIHSGTLLACLVNCIAPGLIPNYAVLNPEDKLENLEEAMDKAKTWLSVAKLLNPEDMASTSVSHGSL